MTEGWEGLVVLGRGGTVGNLEVPQRESDDWHWVDAKLPRCGVLLQGSGLLVT